MYFLKMVTTVMLVEKKMVTTMIITMGMKMKTLVTGMSLETIALMIFEEYSRQETSTGYRTEKTSIYFFESYERKKFREKILGNRELGLSEKRAGISFFRDLLIYNFFIKVCRYCEYLKLL